MLVHNLLFYSVVFASPKMLFVEITICRATSYYPSLWRLNQSASLSFANLSSLAGVFCVFFTNPFVATIF